jgi:hypothetical protein
MGRKEGDVIFTRFRSVLSLEDTFINDSETSKLRDVSLHHCGDVGRERGASTSEPVRISIRDPYSSKRQSMVGRHRPMVMRGAASLSSSTPASACPE